MEDTYGDRSVGAASVLGNQKLYLHIRVHIFAEPALKSPFRLKSKLG